MQAEAAHAQLNGTAPTIDLPAMIAELNGPVQQDGIQWLKSAFGDRDAVTGRVTPIHVTADFTTMRGTGRSSLERCTRLTEAQGYLQGELMRADKVEVAQGRQAKYEGAALKAVQLIEFDAYEAGWANLEAMKPDPIYEQVTAAMLLPPPDAAVIYGNLPADYPAGANQNDPFGAFAP